MRSAARSPDLGEGGKRLIHDGGKRRRMPRGRDAPDRLARRLAHLFDRRPDDARAAETLGERRGVDAVRSARHDEKRCTVRPEHERVGDGADLDAQRGGRERRRRRGIRQHDDLAPDAGRPQGVLNEAAARMEGVVAHAPSLRLSGYTRRRSVAPTR